jgi:hypothetical protein
VSPPVAVPALASWFAVLPEEVELPPGSPSPAASSHPSVMPMLSTEKATTCPNHAPSFMEQVL